MTAKLATLLVASAAAVAACGDTSGPAFGGDSQRYLLAGDQMASPDFAVSAPPATRTAADLAAGDSAVAQRLTGDGLAGAASVTYARVVDFGTANGPIEVIDTVERFASSSGAHASYAADVAARDAASGEVPASTGALGDEAHADSLVKTAPDGLQAVQVIVEWRTANVVVLLTVRGRYGGTRLDDALLLAHRQESVQLAG